MQLLIAVINDPDRVDDVLAGFLELGITGATIIATAIPAPEDRPVT